MQCDKTVGDDLIMVYNGIQILLRLALSSVGLHRRPFGPSVTSGCRTSLLIKIYKKDTKDSCIHFVLKLGIECHLIKV